MSRKRNRKYEYDEDRKAASKIYKKNKKNTRSGRRSVDKDYLKEVITGDIDPDMFQDYIDQKQN